MIMLNMSSATNQCHLCGGINSMFLNSMFFILCHNEADQLSNVLRLNQFFRVNIPFGRHGGSDTTRRTPQNGSFENFRVQECQRVR